MKEKHLKARIEQCKLMAGLSCCPRAKFGCVIINPVTNSILSEGYNGTPRGFQGELCGGTCCLRSEQGIPSGRDTQVGCIHAEANAVCNAARNGIAINGSHAIVSGECCLSCAKLLFQSGIVHVWVLSGGYTTKEGCDFLTSMGVKVTYVES